MLQRHTTKPQTLRFSSHTSLFWTLPEQLSILHHACVPTHPEDTPQNLRPQDFHLTHPSFELCRSSSPYYTTHVCQPWTNVPKIHHKTSDPKIFISHIPVLNFAGTDCTSHVCQPWTNIAKTQHKTSDPKIFISHIPVLNFAGAALHITPRMWANPSWTNVPRHTTNFNPKIFISHTPVLNFAGTDYTMHVRQPWTKLQRHTTKPQTLRFSSHTSLFWTLPEQLSILHHACVPTHPEDTPQNLRPQDFHLTHPSFELCRSSSPYYTTHVCQPWTNVPKIHHKTSDPKIFISHIPVLNFAGTALRNTPRMWANPSWTNVPRHSTNFNPKIFISHIPVLNFAGTDCTSHVCQPWTNVAKTQHKTSDSKIFISHIPVLNFAGAALHITPRMWANPSGTNVPRHTTNFNPKIFISHIPVLNFAGTTRNRLHHACANPEPMLQWHTTKPQTLRFSSHTSLFWTLPVQLSILHHACVPTHPEDTPQNLRP